MHSSSSDPHETLRPQLSKTAQNKLHQPSVQETPHFEAPSAQLKYQGWTPGFSAFQTRSWERMPPPYSRPGLLNFSELAETRIRQIIHISEEFWDELHPESGPFFRHEIFSATWNQLFGDMKNIFGDMKKFWRHEMHFADMKSFLLRHESIFGDMKFYRRHEIIFSATWINIGRHEIISATWNTFQRHEMILAPTWVHFWRHEILLFFNE